MLSDYIYLIIFLVIGVGMVFAAFLTSWFFRPYKPNEKKISTYECGEVPFGTARIQINFRYYIYALLFLIFDLEVIFLIPWAVKFKEFVSKDMGILVLTEIIIFLLILVLGLIYAWRKGALKWE